MVEITVHIRTAAALIRLLPLALLACGTSKVDLDDSLIDPLIEASSDPSVLAVVRERIERMLVVDERLYWAGSHLPADDYGVWSLRSCQKRNCAATLVTYDAPPHALEDTFSVSGGEVYWYRSHPEPYRLNPEKLSGEVVACPLEGCGGSPRTLASKLSLDRSSPTFHDDQFYFSNSSSLYSLSLSQPGSPLLIASLPRTLQAITIHAPYAYGLRTEADDPTGTSNTSSPGLLIRARTDGTSGVETLASDVMLSPNRALGLTTDATSIYWTNNLLAGSISRCPLTGCRYPDPVIGPLRAPQKLQIDGSELYYVYEPQPYRYALSSCTLPACAPSLPLIEHLDAPGALAIDDEYLYVATTEQDVSPSNSTENTVATIRRMPKPHREAP